MEAVHGAGADAGDRRVPAGRIGFGISILSIELFVRLAQTVPLAQLLPWLGVGPLIGVGLLRPLWRAR